MTKITENVIETFCIELLEKQGYEYIYAPVLPPIATIRNAAVLKR
jgi:type I restriction enzyme R subunit